MKNSKVIKAILEVLVYLKGHSEGLLLPQKTPEQRA